MSDTTVLVLVDHRDGMVGAPALELLTAARALGAPEAVWLGPHAPDETTAAELARHGAGVVHHVALDAAAAHRPEVVAAALGGLAEAAGDVTVLLASSFPAKEAAARLAWHLGAALMVDVAGLERGDGGEVVATQQAFAATWTLRARSRRARTVVTVKANAVPAEPLDGQVVPGSVEVRTAPVPAVDDRGVRVVERTERPRSDRPPLGEAHVVVVGGRGTEGDFSQVEELADVLGGAVGATRVATDEGWIGHEAQIGQTGVTISPRLYIGAGVSGAVHHRGGMQSSGTIVAINSDPDAPIFEIADYGVVGDLRTVLPQLTEHLRQLRG